MRMVGKCVRTCNTNSRYVRFRMCICKTNFRSFINERKLNCLVKNSGDGWWHGFQHGIGLLGHGAPIAYLKGLKCIYIASSYTPKDNVTCASHPSIDNCVEFCNCHIIHDQYEYSRQEK